MAGKIIQEGALVRRKFINHTGKIAKRWGLGEPTGRVWGAVLLSHRPVDQREIARSTGYSLSQVSPSLRILEQMHLINAIKVKKKKMYAAIGSFVESFSRIIERFVQNEVRPLARELNSFRSSGKTRSARRLKTIAKDYAQIEIRLRMLSAGG